MNDEPIKFLLLLVASHCLCDRCQSCVFKDFSDGNCTVTDNSGNRPIARDWNYTEACENYRRCKK